MAGHGGTLENRTRFLFAVVDGIRATVPGLGIGVRLSVIDSVPYRKTADGLASRAGDCRISAWGLA